MKKDRLRTEIQETAVGLAGIGVMRKLRVHRGSGNVFVDLGFAPAEAGLLLLKSNLMLAIRKVADRMTSAAAAKRFGVTRSRLVDVLRGRIDKLSSDTLVGMLAHAGMQLEVRVTKRRRNVRAAT